jgi:hypothetical protein
MQNEIPISLYRRMLPRDLPVLRGGNSKRGSRDVSNASPQQTIPPSYRYLLSLVSMPPFEWEPFCIAILLWRNRVSWRPLSANEFFTPLSSYFPRIRIYEGNTRAIPQITTPSSNLVAPERFDDIGRDIARCVGRRNTSTADASPAASEEGPASRRGFPGSRTVALPRRDPI